MELTVAETFRLVAIFVGALVAFFALRIYSLTKGGSKGWKYMAIAAVSLFLWATLQIIFSMVFDVGIIRIMTGIVLLPMIGIFMTLSFITLTKDMKIKAPSWFTSRAFALYFLAILLILLLYNFLTPFEGPIQEILSISHFMVPASLLFALKGAYLLWRNAGNRAWAVLLACVVIIIIGLSLIAYSANCCGLGAPFSDSQECQSYRYDYVDVTSISCNPLLIPLSLNGSVLLLLAILLYSLAYYMLWGPMEYMRSGA